MSNNDEACACPNTSPEYMGALCTVRPSNVQQMPHFRRGETVSNFVLRSIILRTSEDRYCFDTISQSHRATYVAVFNNMIDLANNLPWFKDFIGECYGCFVVVRDSLAHVMSFPLIEVMFDCSASCTLVQMYNSELDGSSKRNVAAIIGNESFLTRLNAPAIPLVEYPTNVEQIMRNRGFRTMYMFAIDFSR